ncbi:extensin-like [Triticum dicoccoides]|uniref:extensin-like n=1 Tax=Triticum dicoccoides TaxID=85692 RepID=UPI00188F49C8|nr:extensin-like [Triticum dicoccoides]
MKEGSHDHDGGSGDHDDGSVSPPREPYLPQIIPTSRPSRASPGRPHFRARYRQPPPHHATNRPPSSAPPASLSPSTSLPGLLPERAADGPPPRARRLRASFPPRRRPASSPQRRCPTSSPPRCRPASSKRAYRRPLPHRAAARPSPNHATLAAFSPSAPPPGLLPIADSFFVLLRPPPFLQPPASRTAHRTMPSRGGDPPPERPVHSQPPLQAVQCHHPNRFTTSLRCPSNVCWCSQRRSAPLLLTLSISATPRSIRLDHAGDSSQTACVCKL